jgi:hypothetical protein
VLQLPWVWDATFDATEQYVSLVTVNRGACDFNVKAWQALSNLFPDHADVLGSGLMENVLINTDISNTGRRRKKSKPIQFSDYFMREEGILGKSYNCNFYKEGVLMHSVASYPVRIKRDIRRVSPIVIICPFVLSKEAFNSQTAFDRVSLSLQTHDTMYANYTFNVYNQQSRSDLLPSHRRESNLFPVCQVPSYDSMHRKYGTSICTAIMGGNRDTLVEWIEYHRLIGA